MPVVSEAQELGQTAVTSPPDLNTEKFNSEMGSFHADATTTNDKNVEVLSGQQVVKKMEFLRQ